MRFDTPVSKPKLYEIVADKIELEILQNPDQVGQKLPSEQELATGFGVSRTVVRESIKLLEERHLVSVRNGEGVYVEKPQNDALAEVLRRIILMDSIDSEKIYELRLILEPAACGMAARNCAGHPEAFSRLEELFHDTVQYRDDKEKRVQNDLEFHVEIARLSGNPILLCFVNAIRQMIATLMDTAVSTADGNDLGVQYHQRILQVLKSGDEAEAFRAMESHLKGCSKYFN